MNVLGASLDWWYSETYTQVESTFLVQFAENNTATGWTLLPAETTFDVTSAVANPTCNSVTAFNSLANETQLHYTCWETPTPVAAATTTVEQTAFKPINGTSSTGTVPDIVTTPTPAALSIGKSNETVAAGKSIVHFSQYEIVSKRSNRRYDGQVECFETTTTHQLNKTHSFEYKGRNLDSPAATDEGVVGKLQLAFLQAVGQATATPGTWVAEPTVVVLVEKIAAAQAVLAKGFVEQPADALRTITPTLPPGLSTLRTTPTEEGTFWVPLTARIESSADALDVPTRTKATKTPAKNDATPTDEDVSIGVPFIAHVENSAVTLKIPVNPTRPHSVVTAIWDGKTVTATALPIKVGSDDDDDIDRIVSAVVDAATPKNALDVLKQAQQTASRGGRVESSNSPASAIAAIIGAVPGSSTSGGSDGAVGSPGGLGNTNGQSSHGQVGASGPAAGGQNNGDSGVIGHIANGSNGQGSGSAVHPGEQSSNGEGESSESQDGDTDPGSSEHSPSGGQAQATQGADMGTNGNSRPVLNIGGSTVTGTFVGDQTAPAMIIEGQTAVAGGQAITIDGKRVAVLPGAAAIVVDGSTMHFAAITADPGALANIPLVTIDGNVFTANAATQFNIAGSTLTPGGQVVVSSTTISLAPDASQIIVGGQTRELSPPVITPAPLLTLDGTVYKPNQGSTYNVNGQLLAPGGAVIVSGTTVSLASDGTNIFVDGSRQLSTGAGGQGINLETITAPPMLAVDGQAYSPNGGTSYIISGQTLTPGGAITFDGPAGLQTISLNDNANQVVSIANGVSGTSTIGMIGAAASGAPILTIDRETYTAVGYSPGSGARYVVSGQTLTPGGSITLSGNDGVTTISLVPAGTAVITISDGTTSTSKIAGAYGVLPTNAPVLTIGGETFTAVNNGATYNIHGDILTPGGTDTVVIGGQTYVVTLSPYATLLEVQVVGSDGKTTSTLLETLFPATMAGSTFYNPAFTDGAAATAGASRTDGSASPTEMNTAYSSNRGSSSMAFELTATIIMLSSLVLALWL